MFFDRIYVKNINGEKNMKKTTKKQPFKWGYIALMLITAAIGACLLIFNNQSLEALAITIGAVVTLAGIFFAVSAFANKERGWSFGFKIALSVAMLICGITTMISRTSAINIIIGIFGLVLIMDGSFKFQTTAVAKRYRTPIWWVMLAISVALIAGGYIIVRKCTIDWNGTVYFLGGLFIIDALANFLSAFVITSNEKKAEAELREQIIREEREKAEKSKEEKKERRGFFKRKAKSDESDS